MTKPCEHREGTGGWEGGRETPPRALGRGGKEAGLAADVCGPKEGEGGVVQRKSAPSRGHGPVKETEERRCPGHPDWCGHSQRVRGRRQGARTPRAPSAEPGSLGFAQGVRGRRGVLGRPMTARPPVRSPPAAAREDGPETACGSSEHAGA